MIKKVICVSLYVPYKGVPYAGADYVGRHISSLLKEFDVGLVAPKNIYNHNRDTFPAVDTHLIGGDSPTGAKRIVELVVRMIRGASLGPAVERAARADPILRDWLTSADFVEFQFTEAASISKWIRDTWPRLKQIVVIHDVMSQRWQREALKAKRLSRRVFYSLRSHFARSAERRVLRGTDATIVFSDKDKLLLKEICPDAEIYVVPPPLATDAFFDVVMRSTGSQFLFVGALNRQDNDDAACWLVEYAWPRISAQVPKSALTIAGASPSARLTVLAEGTTGVTLTGYLEELDSVFSSHDIFLAPLFTGAGVKFKNIHAMLAGEPVITTSIGAEGIGDHSLFAAVVDTLDEFTTEAIELANNPIKRFEVARRAQRWAREQYGEELFRTRLLDVYVGTGCGE